MRYAPIQKELFIKNRQRLAALLQPKSLAAVNNNDLMPTNADGNFRLQPNSDLFYLTGIEQEESILLIFPEAHESRMREILFIRESSPLLETWEGRKLSKDDARRVSGIERVEWVSSFPQIFHTLMGECDHVYLNANEHARADVVIQTRNDGRDARATRCDRACPFGTGGSRRHARARWRSRRTCPSAGRRWR